MGKAILGKQAGNSTQNEMDLVNTLAHYKLPYFESLFVSL